MVEYCLSHTGFDDVPALCGPIASIGEAEPSTDEKPATEVVAVIPPEKYFTLFHLDSGSLLARAGISKRSTTSMKGGAFILETTNCPCAKPSGPFRGISKGYSCLVHRSLKLSFRFFVFHLLIFSSALRPVRIWGQT